MHEGRLELPARLAQVRREAAQTGHLAHLLWARVSVTLRFRVRVRVRPDQG